MTYYQPFDCIFFFTYVGFTGVKDTRVTVSYEKSRAFALQTRQNTEKRRLLWVFWTEKKQKITSVHHVVSRCEKSLKSIMMWCTAQEKIFAICIFRLSKWFFNRIKSNKNTQRESHTAVASTASGFCFFFFFFISRKQKEENLRQQSPKVASIVIILASDRHSNHKVNVVGVTFVMFYTKLKRKKMKKQIDEQRHIFTTRQRRIHTARETKVSEKSRKTTRKKSRFLKSHVVLLIH